MNTNGKVVFHGIGPGPRGYLDGFFDRFTKPKLRVRELENGKRSKWFNRGCNCKHACLITFFEIKRKGDSVTRVDGKSSVKNSRIIRIILSPRRDRGAERGERRNVSYCFQNVSPSKLKLRVLLERSSQFFLTLIPSYKGILNKCKKQIAKEKANSFRAKFIYTWLPRVFKIYNIP